MDPDYRKMTRFLRDLGTDDISHSDKSFLAHLVAVHRDLEKWGCRQAVCRAGMFHSIYGTELFQKFSLPIERRDEVRDLIGERAEHLGYLNCAMDRPSFDANFDAESPGQGPARRMIDRLTGETLQLSPDDFQDLSTIQVCDWLEQVARSKKWDYRRDAYRKMAHHLGGVARSCYETVFACESTETVG